MKTFLPILAIAPAALAVRIERRQTAQTVPGKWIAVLNDGHELKTVLSHVSSLGAASSAHASAMSAFSTNHDFDFPGFKGFSFDGNDDVLSALSTLPGLSHIHPDTVMSIAAPVPAADQTQSQGHGFGKIDFKFPDFNFPGMPSGFPSLPDLPGFSQPSSANPRPTSFAPGTTRRANPTGAPPTTRRGNPTRSSAPRPTTVAPTEAPTDAPTDAPTSAPTATSGGPTPTGGAPGSLTTQASAPNWGLGRISHKQDGSDDYVYDSSAGAGAYAYVIDTGVNAAHSEFEGRATQAKNFVSGEANEDLAGHGTHCSGIIGSKSHGVAKKINIIGIKVLNAQGSGMNSDIIAGIQWAVKDAQTNNRVGKSVISLSIGGSFDSSSNAAVAAAVKAGVFVAVAAGNDNSDSSNYSPASEPTVCTIGASDSNDQKASFSNYGKLVDVVAPGVNILSTWIGGTSATKSISGTSMATPHVAGLAAYFLIKDGTSTPAALCSRIASLNTGVLKGFPSGTVNALAYNNNGI